LITLIVFIKGGDINIVLMLLLICGFNSLATSSCVSDTMAASTAQKNISLIVFNSLSCRLIFEKNSFAGTSPRSNNSTDSHFSVRS
jgi:hypothetical protein